MLTPIKTPVIAKKMFPNYIWDLPTSNKIIYLTFDDGPTPEITNWTLEVLKQFNAKATFFCIGRNIEKHPDIFQNIITDGHAIGNHTHNHIKGWKTNAKDYVENIAVCDSILKKQMPNAKYQAQTSKNYNLALSNSYQKSLITTLFRPPYGQITPKQGKTLIALNYKIIMWDVLSFDWEQNVSPETCYKNVIKKATTGSIVVFHDSIKASKNMQFALPKVLNYFTDKGYSFESLNLED
jgi:peptidoglycan/xylan/chitin deacetylase (PgdA/CDA1 family)